MFSSHPPTGDDVVHFEDAERELAAANVAPVFLMSEQQGLVLAVRNRRDEFSDGSLH